MKIAQWPGENDYTTFYLTCIKKKGSLYDRLIITLSTVVLNNSTVNRYVGRTFNKQLNARLFELQIISARVSTPAISDDRITHVQERFSAS